MDFLVFAIMSIWSFQGANSQCSSVNVTDRIGAIEFSTKTFNDKYCDWIFQPRQELVLIIKFFHLNQGFRDHILLPNGEQTIFNTPSNYCRSYVYQNSSVNSCWRRKNWSYCPQQIIDDFHWPPKLTVIEQPGEIKEEEELSFGLLYAFVDCTNDLILSTSFTTDIKPTLPTTKQLDHTTLAICECDVWKNILIAIAVVSILAITVLAIALTRECRNNNSQREEETEKIFQAELATHVAFSGNREDPTNHPTLPRGSIHPEPTVTNENYASENIYSAIPISQQIVTNVLYQSYKETENLPSS